MKNLEQNKIIIELLINNIKPSVLKRKKIKIFPEGISFGKEMIFIFREDFKDYVLKYFPEMYVHLKHYEESKSIQF